MKKTHPLKTVKLHHIDRTPTPKPPMKTHDISQKALILAAILSLASFLPAQAQTKTWDNTKLGGDWTVDSNWIGEVAPTADDDVNIIGPFVNQTGNISITDVLSFSDLLISLDADTSHNVTVNQRDATGNFTGDSLTLLSDASANTLKYVVKGAASGRSLAITGDITVGASGIDGTTGIADFFAQFGANVSFANMYLRAADGLAGRSKLSFGASTSALTNTLTGNVFLQPGGAIQENGGTATGTNHITGNLTMSGGTLNAGRAGTAGDEITTKVGGTLAMSDGIITVFGKQTLEVVGGYEMTGGLLRFNAKTDVAGDGVLKTEGNMTIAGGTVTTNNSNQTNRIEVGGNLLLQNAPTMNLSATLGSMKLKGNLDIQSTTLGGSTTLNNLFLTANGTGIQAFEAAVSNDSAIFKINTLEIADGVTLRLVDNYNNVSGTEFFWTTNLTNLGTATLDLNGIAFYYGPGQTLLNAGVYNDFGGTLFVIPEPSTMTLLGVALVGVILLGRRGRRKVRQY